MQPAIVSVPMGNGMSRGEVIPVDTDDVDYQVLSQQEQAELERRVEKAKSLLVLDRPFYGMAVSKRDIIYDYKTKTASMDARGQMRLNPYWCFQRTVHELIFLLAHEALHYMLCHSLRMGNRNATMWNIACDEVINDTLIEDKVGTFIEGGVTFDGARNHSAEELYTDPPDDDGDDDGDDEGGTGRRKRNGGIGNDVAPPQDGQGQPLSESEIKELEGRAKVEAIQNAKAAKAQGKLSANLERMIDEIVNVKTPWYDILERFMTNKIRDGKSWRRQNRKFISKNIYLKGKDNLPQMGEIVIGVDTSGSIQQPELDAFNAHVDRILDTCNPESVTVIYCDDEVNHVDVFEPEDFPVRLSPHGGGGTAFDPVFDYIDEHKLDPEVVVYLTDGYGNQNDFTSKHETVWLTTGSTDFAWGTVIEFDISA